MQNKNLYILFTLTILVFFSCKKYPPPPQIIDADEQCELLPDFNNTLNPVHQQMGADAIFDMGQYNKQNADEIIYFKRYKDNRPDELINFNLRTGVLKTVIRNSTNLKIIRFSVGPNGFIILESDKNELWKIETNGQNLMQLTFENTGGKAYNSTWNKAGDKILYYVKSGTNAGKNIISDLTGNILNIFNSGTPQCRFSQLADELILGCKMDSGNMFLYNITFNKSIKKYPTKIPDYAYINSALSTNGYEMIVTDEKYIYRVNMLDSSTVPLRNECETKQYGFPDYSPDGQHILFTKETWTKVNETLYSHIRELYVMDKDCKHAVKLNVK